MSDPQVQAENAVAKAVVELAELQQQTVISRATLTRLQEDLVCAERRLGSTQSVQLREANEQLVVAMMRARSEADVALSSLQSVSRAAELDSLTALPNRQLLLDRFALALTRAQQRGTRLALLFLDLNDFKQINLTFGHAIGDRLLYRAAQSLTSAVRECDTVSRYGGDEFLILIAEVNQASDAVAIAEKVIAALGMPFQIDEHVLRLTASIGISLYPDDGKDVNTLIDRADAAMCRAQKFGLGSFVFHGQDAPTEHPSTLHRQLPQRGPLLHQESALAEHEKRNAQMREANEQLVLAALNAQELQAATQRAQRQQTEFLAMLAHELRNPLAPIRTTAALLGRVQAHELPRLRAVIERQVKHLTRLVDDLFDVSRVNTGKLRLEPQTVEMAAIIAEAIDSCRPAMDLRLQHFAVYVPARALEVRGDPVRLAQVLGNLLDNASKYTPVGGEIRLSVVVVDTRMVITVSDNGIGIAPDALAGIFEPFVQDPRATDFNSDGLGLGLTVVRELIEAHGGTVIATSAGSVLGSQFVVTLPLAGGDPLAK